MLFFGMFLHETARPVAKSRTNLAQIQEKLPYRWTDWHQIWHTCADSSGNGYMPNQLNLKTQGGISVFLGGYKSQSLGRLSNDWTDWHQIWYMSADSSGNGHRLTQLAPRYPRAALWVVLWVQQFKRLGNCGQTAGRIGNQFCTYNAYESGNGQCQRLNKLAPKTPRGALWRGVK